MLKYIAKRIVYMIFILLILSVVLFFLYNMVPGDRARAELEPMKDKLTAEQYEIQYQQIRERLGLNDPMIVRYGKWLKGIVRLDLGESSQFKRPVTKVLVPPMKVTVFVNIFSIFLALAITIPLGILCAVKKNSTFDKITQVVTIVGYSIPIYIFALIFIYLFAVKTNGLFPVSGFGTPDIRGSAWTVFKDKMWYLFLPLLSMTFASLGGMTRYVRAAMADALSMDYIKTARAKGLKERVVIYSHAWRNALLPVITLIIGWLMSIFSGSLVIESMFNIQGMGMFYITALNNQDWNVALGIQMFYIIMALLGNLITDLSYGLVDPRVRVNK